MNRTLIGILAGLGLAAFAAHQLGGRAGTGVLCGYLFGASIGALGVSWQRHVLRTRPEAVYNAGIVSFLFKLAGVLLGAVTLRYVDAAAEVADWTSFTLAYAFAAIICLLVGSMEIARALRAAAPTSATSPRSTGESTS